MTHVAALGKHLAHFGVSDGRGIHGSRCRARGFGTHPHNHAEQNHHASHRKGQRVLGATQVVAMALHKELTDQGTCQHHHHQDDPMVFVGVQEAVVVAQHRKDDGQGEVGVVHAALLATLAVHGQLFGVHGHAGRHGSHHFALTRDDPEEHVGAHGRGNHRAHQKESRTACKQLARQPGCKAHHRNHGEGHNAFAVFTETKHAAHGVVNQPKGDQETQRSSDGRCRRPVHQRLVNQERACVPQVKHGEQTKTGEPSGITFPIKPVQLGVDFLGGHHVFLGVVKTTAVHRPHGTVHAFFQQVGGIGFDEVVV